MKNIFQFITTVLFIVLAFSINAQTNLDVEGEGVINGELGINTIPSGPLHIKTSGSGLLDGIRIQTSTTSNEDWYIYMDANDDLLLRNDGGSQFVTFQKNTGNVGIGTTDPQGYKLAVKGSIGSELVEVRTNYWADFVFENDYQLRSIKETEQFIQENKHLPTMPSEEEAINTPLNLGDMDVKLLQTVEEQMLYIIELKKENEAQQKLIEQQALLMQQMEERLNKLEKLNNKE